MCVTLQRHMSPIFALRGGLRKFDADLDFGGRYGNDNAGYVVGVRVGRALADANYNGQRARYLWSIC